VAGGSDEVEQRMNTIVAEAGITLDTGLLCKNVVVLSLEIANNFTEAFLWSVTFETIILQCLSYLASLSIWSPKPGVSTMVKEMRVPSSSNSSSARYQHLYRLVYHRICMRTNGDGFDSDTLLDVGVCSIISILSLENFLST
jgi:hypothetical protein